MTKSGSTRPSGAALLSSAFSSLVPPALVVLGALVLWELAIILFRPQAYLLPGPRAILAAAVEQRSMLAAASLRSAAASLAGFALSGLLGLAIGSALSTSRFLQRGFYPIATLFQMVPLVAIAPLLVIWFGYGMRATIASAAIVSIFPVLANTLDGMRSVDPGLRELFAIHRAGPLARWWKLSLPAATPQIVTGLRIAAGLAVIGTIVGEFVSGYAGREAPLGIVILSAMREYRTDLVFAAVGIAAAIGMALFGVVSFGGWLLLRRWYP
ncbi:MAG TPA: ABC transporter permease subunit [Phycisphaerales bacterium]|nr:ABC transporter permease subunit [Phycisphaerales bacterium]HMP37799.1 ABC transporter permease subunit [Phycisphaerales bacterium]